jgi:hypothetical protein
VLLFKDTSTIWDTLKKVYTTSFKELVTGALPDERDVLNTLLFLSKRIEKIAWDVKNE